MYINLKTIKLNERGQAKNSKNYINKIFWSLKTGKISVHDKNQKRFLIDYGVSLEEAQRNFFQWLKCSEYWLEW